MKTEKRKLEKKPAKKSKPERQIKTSNTKRQASKDNASTRTKQYPEKIGYHGTDDEKTLNPEE